MAISPTAASPGAGRGGLGLMALAAVMCSAVFWVPWVAGRFPFHGVRGEMLMQWLPYRVFLEDCYRSGEFPLWVPYIFGGMPFWGYSHTMAAYPIMTLSLLLPTFHGTCFFFVFHAALAAAGTFRLLERLNFGRGLAFAGTVMMAAGGFGLSLWHREFYLHLAAWSWLPIMVLAFMKLMESGSARWFCAATAALLMELLTGDIEAVTYNFLTVVIFLVLVRPGGRALAARRRWAAVALAAGFAFLAASAMWLPLVEYMPHNVRSEGVTLPIFQETESARVAARKPSLTPATVFAGLFLPGNSTGWLVVFFAGFHLLRKRRAGSALLAAAALLFMAYCLRLAPALDEVLYRLPVVSSFLKRTQALGGATFLFQFLALLGMRDFVDDARRGAWRRWALWLSATGLTGSGVFLALAVVTRHGRAEGALAVAGYAAAALMAWPGPQKRSDRRAQALVLATALLTIWAPFIAGTEFRNPDDYRSELFKAAAAKIDPGYRHLNAAMLSDNVSHLYTQQGMLYGLDEVYGWNRVPPRRYLDLIALADPALIGYENGKLANWSFVFQHSNGSLLRGKSTALLELLGVRYFLGQNIPTGNISPFYVAWLLPPAERELRFAADQWRDLYVTSRPLRFSARAGSSSVLRFGLGWSAGSPAGVADPARVEVRVDGTTYAFNVPVSVSRGSPGRSDEIAVPLAAFAGRVAEVMVDARFEGPRPAGLRLTRARIEDPELAYQLAYSNDSFDMYENPRALPTAFVARRVEVFADGGSLLARLSRASRDELGDTALTLRGDGGFDRDSSGPPGPGLAGGGVAAAERRPGRIEYVVESDGPAVLVVTQNRLPGWRAFVDGREERLFGVDWAFGGVRVGPGKQRVELCYRPAGFRLGLWISVSAGVVLGAILLFGKNMIK